MEEQRMALEEELEKALRRVRDLDREHTDSRNKLERGAAAFVLVQHLGDLREKYQDSDEVLLYLNQVRDDILERLHDFRPVEEPSEENAAALMGPMIEEDSWQRYKVNLIIDHSKSKGAPVILEDFPSYSNLVGRIEGTVQMGALQMDFMGIKAGAFHKANGGYLVLRARDVLTQPDAWDGLKRALLSRQIRIEESGLRTGLGVLTPQTIDPEPIPLDVKVVLLGDPGLYYALYAGDENFSDLFKVKSDFASIMPRTEETEQEYAVFIAARCHERKLPHFSAAAVGAVIEQGARMAGDQTKLSTLFGELTDLIHEAAYWAKCDNAQTVEARHVTQALEEARYRSNLLQERTLEQIERQIILIDTVGSGRTGERLSIIIWAITMRIAALRRGYTWAMKGSSMSSARWRCQGPSIIRVC
jgi:predicted ATP-dependent protease